MSETHEHVFTGRWCEICGTDKADVPTKTPAQLYSLGYAQYDAMLNEGMDISTVRHLAAGLGQDMYAVGARTALGVHEERLAR